MRRNRLLISEAPQLNITPLIDMVFILLIFFVVNASFVREAGVEIERPTAKTAVTQKQATIFIAITQDGKIWIDQKETDIRLVQARVARLLTESPRAGVVVLADKRVPVSRLLEVIDAARLAGATHVAVAATLPR